jgi:hypothetical protein
MKNAAQRLQLFLEYEDTPRSRTTVMPFTLGWAQAYYSDAFTGYVRSRCPAPLSQLPWLQFLASHGHAPNPDHDEVCYYVSPKSISGYRPRRELLAAVERLRADLGIYYLSDIAGDYLLTVEGMLIHLFEQLGDCLEDGTPLSEAAPDLIWFRTMSEARAAFEALSAYDRHVQPFCINDPLFICQ